MGIRGKGQGIAFLRSHVGYCGDDCLKWPMSTNGRGYGVLGFEGQIIKAHRLMCELVHGPAPTPEHQAAHSCGKGHERCVNPRHLSWKTASENQVDRKVHGTTAVNLYGSRTKLTLEQIERIRSFKGKMAQYDVAKLLGIGRGTVEYWQRHNRPPAPPGQSESAQQRRRAAGT